MSTPGEQSPLGSEIVVSLAVHPDFERHVDLMMGFHPDEKRELTELEERAADYATLLAPTAVITMTAGATSLTAERGLRGDEPHRAGV